MKQGDKILWDTGAGYDTGEWVKTSNLEGKCIIKLHTGHFKNKELCVLLNEVMQHTDENLILLNKRYKQTQ